jgi:hypothetical protein
MPRNQTELWPAVVRLGVTGLTTGCEVVHKTKGPLIQTSNGDLGFCDQDHNSW